MRADQDEKVLEELTRLSDNIESFTTSTGTTSVKTEVYQKELIDALAKINSTIELLTAIINSKKQDESGTGGAAHSGPREIKVHVDNSDFVSYYPYPHQWRKY